MLQTLVFALTGPGSSGVGVVADHKPAGVGVQQLMQVTPGLEAQLSP